jgi:hypothetical protein
MKAKLTTVIAAGIAAVCVAVAVASEVRAEIIQTNKFCFSSRKSTGETLTDRNCRVDITYGAGIDPPINAITIRWSDGYRTNIRITGGHESIGRTTGLFFGRASVDGEDSDFIRLNDGMICFVIVENGNEICYR